MSRESFVPILKRLPDWIALAFWLFLAGVRLAQVWQEHSAVLALLMLQAVLVAYRLVNRSKDVAEIPLYKKVVAWVSALLPLGMQVGTASWPASLVTAGGLMLATWSLLTMGKAFGIAPIDRGFVWDGPYRYLRHPMYAGELLAVAGATWGAWSLWNLGVWSLLLFTLILRIRWEEQALPAYAGYAHYVPYRLIPGVW